MKTILRIVVLFAAAALLPAYAQTALTQTSLAAAATRSQNFVTVSSATGITANTSLILVDSEVMAVYALNGTTLSVQRGSNGTRAVAHVTSSMVLAGPSQAFISFRPSGTCTNGSGLFLYSPIIQTSPPSSAGAQWLCSTISGRVSPGFGNMLQAPDANTLVASAAAKVTPSGPLFHVNGTAAITGFNIPVGFDPIGSGTICVIPDAVFTTTAANNIALASTAVVSKLLCFGYDGAAAKPFFPTY